MLICIQILKNCITKGGYIMELNLDFLLEDIVKNRRALHQMPETALEEFKTKEYLKNYLISIGLEPKDIVETGLYVYIEGKDKDNCIAFRSDIDALNIEEETGIDFVSKNSGKCMLADMMDICLLF